MIRAVVDADLRAPDLAAEVTDPSDGRQPDEVVALGDQRRHLQPTAKLADPGPDGSDLDAAVELVVGVGHGPAQLQGAAEAVPPGVEPELKEPVE